METVKIGVIGGSGLYNMPQITDKMSVAIDTPFGKPSADIIIGTLRGKRVAFLARHGQGHVLAPSAIPQRANMWAMKSLGIRFIISVNAVGSLREDYAPSHLVIPDQLFDYNIGIRERSFFHEGIVAHVSVAEPFDEHLRKQLSAAVKAVQGTVHDRGTLIIEDGARFATRAESIIFRQWGCDIIGMTAAPEAFLAREAEIAYACLTHITDYDSWHEEEEAVTVEMVMATIGKNIDVAKKAVAYVVENLDEETVTPSHSALDGALTTAREAMPQSAIDKLAPILKRALKL
ncbi:MAG: S-methyl-5'-thioadenosine phosphorylase [Anaerolineae bacterium]|nr:S-methyl-5'-thioadenosine phosphorylase [Anaerolineae bacterium]MDQ7036986.1 S-methyl-5'-thioadenosine phosphorylase [Anaerolineae bacterium]